MTAIRTKWHRAVELLNSDEVYLTSPKDKLAPHHGWFDIDRGSVLKLITGGLTTPDFVIDPELYAISSDKEYQRSLLDMKRAGVLKLPYPVVGVELAMWSDSGKCHALVMLIDCAQAKDLGFSLGEGEAAKDLVAKSEFLAYTFRVQSDDQGDYLVLAPSWIGLSVADRDGDPWLGIRAIQPVWLKPLLPEERAAAPSDIETDPEQLVEETYIKDAGTAFAALSAALLLMNTAGVAREVIDVAKLNKRRVLSNKPPIPRHTYIRIGHVYRRAVGEEKEEYVPRRSPRPHWRRGHVKMVHHGPGRVQLRQVYIQPRLVAYNPQQETAEPRAPAYSVKR